LKQEIPLGVMIRTSDASRLAHELQAVRAITLAWFDAYEAAGLLDVPCQEQFNLPLWELGHVAWFQQRWIARNPLRDMGHAANPDEEKIACDVIGLHHHGDAWYDSSGVAHALRWTLPLLDAERCKDYLRGTLEQTLGLLHKAEQTDEALYFYRLALLHEAMHVEAATYMAQALQLPIHFPAESSNAIDSIASCAYPIRDGGHFCFKNQAFQLGSSPAFGFAFDNELNAHERVLTDFEMDARPVSWQRYLQFVQETGYAMPMYLREKGSGFEQQVFGLWQPLNLQSSAVHLSWYDAQAFCLWAGRRLPTEAEWECAIIQERGMAWGDVWEWTSSDFLPYDGFQAHPYRDYSEPWFGSRKVLRGACAATLPVMRNPRYRNYFTPERCDIYAGFRTCAL
jgi:gamma-glutamyl hercynylcysteine S-oxide synthase